VLVARAALVAAGAGAADAVLVAAGCTFTTCNGGFSALGAGGAVHSSTLRGLPGRARAGEGLRVVAVMA
jgi:hypothetical protein